MEEKFASFVKEALTNFIETSSKSDFSEVLIEGPELKIFIRKSDNYQSLPVFNPPALSTHVYEPEESQLQIEEIKSKWVGIFQHNKEKLNVGDKIETGKLLGSVRCMNLLFELKSSVDGEVLDIMVKNEEIVEYGKVLFKISKKQEDFLENVL